MTAVITCDPRGAMLARPGETLDRLASGATWSEGPVWMHEDDSVLWSDIPANRMLRWHARDGMSLWRDQVDFVNGHTREAMAHCCTARTASARSCARASPQV